MGLAYEIVINSEPVHRVPHGGEHDADAGAGRSRTRATATTRSSRATTCSARGPSADAIIDYLVFAKQYISECEERYGVEEVERVLDSCHALRISASTATSARRPLSPEETSAPSTRARGASCSSWSTTSGGRCRAATRPTRRDDEQFPGEPQENLLYFIEKHAPLLEPWQREIVRIVRKIAQYFYPQRQTQVMNEGWATFWHYTLLNRSTTRACSRRLHDGVPARRTPTSLPAGLRQPYYQRHQSVRARLRDVPRPAADLRAPDRRGPRMVPATSPAPTGSRPSTSRCATSRTRASSRSSCRRR